MVPSDRALATFYRLSIVTMFSSAAVFNGKCPAISGRRLSRKRWEIGPWLLLITDRKLHMHLQMRWKSSILDVLERHCQPVRSAILATAGFLFRFRIGRRVGEDLHCPTVLSVYGFCTFVREINECLLWLFTGICNSNSDCDWDIDGVWTY